jgi:hypothetical protein
MVVLKADAKLVGQAKPQQVIYEADHSTRSWFERPLDALGKRSGMDHIVLPIFGDTVTFDQAARYPSLGLFSN